SDPAFTPRSNDVSGCRKFPTCGVEPGRARSRAAFYRKSRAADERTSAGKFSCICGVYPRSSFSRYQARNREQLAGVTALTRRFSRERAGPRRNEKIETKDCRRVKRKRDTPDRTAIERSDPIRSLRENRTRSRRLHREHAGSGRIVSFLPK